LNYRPIWGDASVLSDFSLPQTGCSRSHELAPHSLRGSLGFASDSPSIFLKRNFCFFQRRVENLVTLAFGFDISRIHQAPHYGMQRRRWCTVRGETEASLLHFFSNVRHGHTLFGTEHQANGLGDSEIAKIRRIEYIPAQRSKMGHCFFQVLDFLRQIGKRKFLIVAPVREVDKTTAKLFVDRLIVVLVHSTGGYGMSEDESKWKRRLRRHSSRAVVIASARRKVEIAMVRIKILKRSLLYFRAEQSSDAPSPRTA